MKIVPIGLKKANEIVLQWHRHHKPSVGHKFSIGLTKDDAYVGSKRACIFHINNVVTRIL
jgi:hypothetical protein